MPTRRSVRRAAWGAAVLSAAGAAAQTRPATAPASRPLTLAERQAAERDELVRGSADDPLLPPAPLADVARLARDGDQLRVFTRLPATAGQSRIVVTDLPGLCDVTHKALRRFGRPPPPPAEDMPDAFLFDWYRFDRPGVVVAATAVEVVPGYVHLQWSTETPDGGGTQGLLSELRGRPSDALAAGGDPGVRLSFTPAGDDAGTRTVQVTAESFGALTRLHPAEVARYLEPVLRDLHADAAVLPPDPPLAYQAFAADVAVDAATAARVRSLVARLDADDFHDRDAAGRQLLAAGPVAAAAVARIDAATLSPEQQARTAAVVRHFHPVPDADAARLRDDPDFLLNCLNVADPFVTRVAVARLRAVTGRDVAFDDALAGQPRRDAVWALRQQLKAGPPTTRP